MGKHRFNAWCDNLYHGVRRSTCNEVHPSASSSCAMRVRCVCDACAMCVRYVCAICVCDVCVRCVQVTQEVIKVQKRHFQNVVGSPA